MRRAAVDIDTAALARCSDLYHHRAVMDNAKFFRALTTALRVLGCDDEDAQTTALEACRRWASDPTANEETQAAARHALSMPVTVSARESLGLPLIAPSVTSPVAGERSPGSVRWVKASTSGRGVRR